MEQTTFLDYLSNEHVAQQLCKEAGKYAFRPKHNHIASQLMALMPPKKFWGITPQDRYNHQAQQRIWKRVTHMVIRHVKHQSSYAYVSNILQFASQLRSMVADPTFGFTQPTIKALIKDANASPVVCRPICTYHHIDEKVLIALMANYLKQWIDPTFHENSLAYRAPREWMGERKVTSNKDAIRLILQWRKAHEQQNIYVAECDICKFFDTLDHQRVKNALRHTMNRIGKVDQDLLRLFDGFVDSFDFARDVYAKNDDPSFWDEVFGTDRKQEFCFQWIPNPPDRPVGLPQGAALSPLIANLVLNEIDEQTLGEKMLNGQIVDQDLLYIRYCDDIVLMHTCAEACTRLINRYQQVLQEYNLSYHPFKQVGDMKDGNALLHTDKNYPYWDDAKSKAPYRWGEGRGNAVRWIGFLGYEISRDGQVRIRKSSVAAQAQRLCQQASRIRYAKGQYRETLMNRFVSKEVGGSKLDGIVAEPQTMEQYQYQRKRLEQLKARFVRKINGRDA